MRRLSAPAKAGTPEKHRHGGLGGQTPYERLKQKTQTQT
jgi:hypothetical protein